MKRWRASWSGPNCSVDLRAEGEITFTRDFTDVQRIAEGGFLELSERNGSSLRRLELKPGAGGELLRTYSIDGTARAWDDAARAWLADFLTELDRQTGFAVEWRFPQIYEKGGSQGVLDEVSRLGSDYVKGIYLRRLFEAAQLDEATTRRAIEQAGREMSSDYELANVLITLADRGAIVGASDEAYFAAVSSISSDFERARALKALIGGSKLGTEMLKAVMKSAGEMSSDYEKANVLIALARTYGIDEKLRPAYLEAANGISSDYEQRRVLSELAKRSAY